MTLLFIMVNSAKIYSNKKNCLTCDHTTEEVLTTTITHLSSKHIVEFDLS